MSVSDSYKVLASCSNCRHMFEKFDYDEGPSLFCTADGSRRPKCGSVAMKEDFTFPAYDAPESEWDHVADIEAWNKWSKEREVVPAGFCNLYIKVSP